MPRRDNKKQQTVATSNGVESIYRDVCTALERITSVQASDYDRKQSRRLVIKMLLVTTNCARRVCDEMLHYRWGEVTRRARVASANIGADAAAISYRSSRHGVCCGRNSIRDNCNVST